MDKIDDATLLAEVKRRLEESRIAINSLRAMTQNLEAVNEKLRRSESLKSDFLSNIRNEINNPLTSILGFTRQIADKKADPETAQQMAATIYREAFDLDFQLRNIFTAAELEAGEAASSPARVDVAALVRSQIKAFAHKAEARRETMEFTCTDCAPDGSLTFTTDPDKLQKVLANLLANAIEFNGEGKRVLVRAWQDGGMLQISITDEGIGIPEKDRKQVFDRFAQLDSGARKRHHGHGLGLSITKALVEMLGGSVTLASEEGKGCVFTVSVAELAAGQAVDVSSDAGNAFIFEEGTQY